MFVGVLNPTAEVVRRLQSWADELWPGARSISAGPRCRMWLSADLGVLTRHSLEGGRHLLALDGWTWREPTPAGDVEWGALDGLADLLASPAGWPLPTEWDGSFAAASFDVESETLSLAVDAVGFRRLFFGRRGETVVFGNAQSACAHALSLSPDPPSLALWLGVGYLPGRATLFSGLTEILPGERRRFDGSGQDAGTEIDVPWHDARHELGPDAAAERLAPLLEQNARRFARRLAPGRGGMALSGGMDSRLVLGALGEEARDFVTYTYGAADDQECRLARRCAEAAGARPRLIDLTGRYFPPQDVLRRRALLGEAIAFPFWHYLDEAAAKDGVESILIGDLTNCLNVYIKPLRGRDERKKRALDKLRGRPQELDEDPTSPDEWLAAEAARCTGRTVRLLDLWRIDVSPEEVRERAETGYHELYEHLSHRPQTLFCLMEKFFLAIEREASGGGQVVSLAGTREILPIFSTRRIVGEGFNTSFETRTRRGLIDAVARRVLPRAIRRLPTATIPWVSLDAPKWSQEAMWFLRFSADAALGKVSRRAPDWWTRDRLFKTLPLRPEYQLAKDGDYGEPWNVSGVFSSRQWVRRIRRTAEGARPATVPVSEMQCLAADTQIAAAQHGPGVLDEIDGMAKT